MVQDVYLGEDIARAVMQKHQDVRPNWQSLEAMCQILEDVKCPDEFAKIASAVSISITAVIENIVDTLPLAGSRDLTEGARLAQRAMGLIARFTPVREGDANYLAGRIGAVSEMLNYADRFPEGQSRIDRVTTAAHLEIIHLLGQHGRLRNADLVRLAKKDKSVITRLLGDLRDAEMVISQRRGRETINCLSPDGRALSRHIVIKDLEAEVA